MPRVKGGTVTRRRHKKILKLAKGYRMAKSKIFRRANETLLKALFYAYRDRKAKKRDFRKLWIARINAAARINGISYSRMMDGLKKSGIQINRKLLADLAVSDSTTFAHLAEQAKQQLAAK